jgi:hypothetical protein
MGRWLSYAYTFISQSSELGAWKVRRRGIFVALWGEERPSANPVTSLVINMGLKWSRSQEN